MIYISLNQRKHFFFLSKISRYTPVYKPGTTGNPPCCYLEAATNFLPPASLRAVTQISSVLGAAKAPLGLISQASSSSQSSQFDFSDWQGTSAANWVTSVGLCVGSLGPGPFILHDPGTEMGAWRLEFPFLIWLGLGQGLAKICNLLKHLSLDKYELHSFFMLPISLIHPKDFIFWNGKRKEIRK